jgi:hypothetical protein
MNITDIPAGVLANVVELLPPKEAHRLATLHTTFRRALDFAVKNNAQYASACTSLMVPWITLPSYADSKVYATVAYLKSQTNEKKLFRLFQHTLYRFGNDGDDTWQGIAAGSGGAITVYKYQRYINRLGDVPLLIRDWVGDAAEEPVFDEDGSSDEDAFEEELAEFVWTEEKMVQLAVELSQYVAGRLFAQHGEAAEFGLFYR